MSIGKALILIGKALSNTNQNGQHHRRQLARYQPQQVRRVSQKQPTPFHWHVTLFGRQKFLMKKIGFNHRTGRHVYQCTFGGGSCGGKCERPY
jgi:hypothetical protein